jgi:hypothetical protein
MIGQYGSLTGSYRHEKLVSSRTFLLFKKKKNSKWISLDIIIIKTNKLILNNPNVTNVFK